MQADLKTLKESVIEAIKEAPAKVAIKDIEFESDADWDGVDFLRVIVHLDTEESISDDDLESLLETIEETVGTVDERYPSVRFADAA